MFHVEIKVGKSRIHGAGVFANEDISKGELVYTPNHDLDVWLSVKEFDILTDKYKEFFKHYGYLDKNKNMWHLSHDDIRFCNHSKNPNIYAKSFGKIFAKTDIKKGDELLQDYSDFEVLREGL
jgi:SET domain-containing protein